MKSAGKGRIRRPECGRGECARFSRPTERLEPPPMPALTVSPPGRRRARHLQREPPRLRGSVDLGAAPLAAERAGDAPEPAVAVGMGAGVGGAQGSRRSKRRRKRRVMADE